MDFVFETGGEHGDHAPRERPQTQVSLSLPAVTFDLQAVISDLSGTHRCSASASQCFQSCSSASRQPVGGPRLHGEFLRSYFEGRSRFLSGGLLILPKEAPGFTLSPNLDPDLLFLFH